MNTAFIRVSLFLICFLIVLNIDGFQYSERVAATSLLIMWLSVLGTFQNDDSPYSLFKMFYLFCFFFLGISPYLQFINKSSFFGASPPAERTYFFTNIIIIVIMIIYYVLYRFFYSQSISAFFLNIIEKFEYRYDTFKYRSLLMIFILVSLSFLLVFYYNNFNIISMLIRGGEEKERASLTSSLALLVTKFIQPIPVIALIYYLSLRRRKPLVVFFLFFSSLLIASPTGMPRFAAASLYIPLLLSLSLFKRKNLFLLTFIFSFLVLFPLLNKFRNYSNEQEFSIGLDFGMFDGGAFDSYQNFALVLQDNVITYGRQLFGVLFFWIPRSIWPTKPIGSGAFLAQEMGLYFSNISANYFAEGYINFGFFGIFLFTIIIAYCTAKIDKIYWNYLINRASNFLKVIYLILLGLIFFVLRGDLLSSSAFSIGFLFSAFFIYRLTHPFPFLMKVK